MFAYFPLRKAFGKQIKTTEDHGENQTKALKVLNLEKNKKIN